MTPEASIMVRVADALSAAGIPYLLAGSFSSNYYGIPRSTKDADFVCAGDALELTKDFGGPVSAHPRFDHCIGVVW